MTTEGKGTKEATRKRGESRHQWSRFLGRAILLGNMDDLEAAVWNAAARYAEEPNRDRERELKRAAMAFGIQPPR